MIRGTTSVAPPAPVGMITRIVFDGHACARAIRETAGKALAAATTFRNWRRRSFMAYLCCSTLPFGNGNDTLVFASMATKNAARRCAHNPAQQIDANKPPERQNENAEPDL
jgi:hypothetical protein